MKFERQHGLLIAIAILMISMSIKIAFTSDNTEKKVYTEQKAKPKLKMEPATNDNE